MSKKNNSHYQSNIMGNISCPICNTIVLSLSKHYGQNQMCARAAISTDQHNATTHIPEISTNVTTIASIQHSIRKRKNTSTTNQYHNIHFLNQPNIQDMISKKANKSSLDVDEINNAIIDNNHDDDIQFDNAVDYNEVAGVDLHLVDQYQSSDIDQSIFMIPHKNDFTYNNASTIHMKNYFESITNRIVDHISNNDHSSNVPLSNLRTDDASDHESFLSDSNESSNDQKDFNSILPVLNWIPNNSTHSTNVPLSTLLNYAEQTEINQQNANPSLLNQVQLDINELKKNCFDDFSEHQYNIIHHQRHLVIPQNLVFAVQLLMIQITSNCPNYIYKQIVDWHEQIELLNKSSYLSSNRVNFKLRHEPSQIPNDRKMVIEKLEGIIFESVPSNLNFKPIHSVLPLPSGKFTRISRFSIKEQILSYFHDPHLMSSSNLLCKDKFYRNPTLFDNLPPNEKYIGDIHTGSWF